MDMNGAECAAYLSREEPDQGIVVIQNASVSATVLVDRGATIYEFVHRPSDTDLLWKSPWGQRRGSQLVLAESSQVNWLDNFAGGWPVLFPNGGTSCTYQGAELPFHGDASLTRWHADVTADGGSRAEVKLRTTLARLPFEIVRTMSVAAGVSGLKIVETITNYSREPVDYMWGHHPTFGAPFLSGDCRIDHGARTIVADDEYAGFNCPMPRGERFQWPMVGIDPPTDLTWVPNKRTPRDLLAYLTDFESGWFAITNCKLRIGFGLTWPSHAMPFAWLWQEMGSSPGYPWYRSTYAMAIEPHTSFPAQGLARVVEKSGTHRTLGPGQSQSVELNAFLFESATGVAALDPDGSVVLR